MGEIGSLNRVAELIRETGYRALINEDTIKTAVGGFSVLIFHQPPRYFQFYFGITKDEDTNLSFEAANEFNRKTKFAKCYIAEEYIGFEGDFICDVDGDNALQDMNRIFGIWENVMNLARRAMDQDG